MSNDQVKVAAKNINANFFACELWVKRVGTFGVVLYHNQCPVNFVLYFAELHTSNSIRYENTLFGNYFLKCHIVKRILISFTSGNIIVNLTYFVTDVPANHIFHLLDSKYKCHKSNKLEQLIMEPRHEISNNVVCATSRASDQPAHTHILIRAFASRSSII